MSRRRRSRRAATPAVEARVARMRERVTAEARERPGVYRMVSPDGEILYVGKAKRLRTRLLGYFRAAFPAEKGARIVREAGAVEWDYLPSEFAALLEEMRLIKRLRPRFNVMMKRDARHYAFIRVAAGAAPKFLVVRGAGNDEHGTYYGPFRGASQLEEALRELNDVLGLRIQPTEYRGDVHLTREEREWFARVQEARGEARPYWLFASGGKWDYTIKWWDAARYQQVVDHFRGRIDFVQVGETHHHHPDVRGVTDLRGRTTLRQLVRLMYHAQGAISAVSLLMHLAAAVEDEVVVRGHLRERDGQGRPQALQRHLMPLPPRAAFFAVGLLRERRSCP